MKTIEELVAEAEAEIKRRRELNDALEVKLQRTTIPSPGLAPGQIGYITKRENRALDLGEKDIAFLNYVRSGKESKALKSAWDGENWRRARNPPNQT
jgi:hypothetical protein